MYELDNLFVSTTFFEDGNSVRESINLCKNNNIFNIELGSNHCYEDSYEYLKFEGFRYLVHNYFPIPKKEFVLNLASSNKEIRIKSIDHVINAINMCANINGELYTFHPGFLTDPHGPNADDKNYDFQWDEDRKSNIDYEHTIDLLYDTFDLIINHARDKNVKIAIETQGSFNNNAHLIFQKPEEYYPLINRYEPNEIGINLNLGHLILSSNAFGFSVDEFISIVENYIVAMELSHNDGVEDQHLPIENEAWYWNIIKNNKFSNAFKILEYRNTPIESVLRSIDIYKNQLS